MSRRSFLLGSAGVAGGSFALGLWARHRHQDRRLKTFKVPSLREDSRVGRGQVVVARGDDPKANVQRALRKSGAIEALVSPGDTVVVKPNMAWNLPPALGANADPGTVAGVVELCLEACRPTGRVFVFDRTMARNPAVPYKTSGIAAAADAAGATVHYVDESRFHPVDIPEPYVLDRWTFYDKVLFADQVDVLINIPAAKTHSTSGLTLGMKNVFGMVGGERGQLHQQIHQKIADLNRVVRVDLTMLDATRVMFRNGPNSSRRADLHTSARRAQRIAVSTDPVALDAYGATLFERDPTEVPFVRYAAEAGLGSLRFQVHEV
ncbi:MAG: DUF362 domain-containing protein [Candidatus Brocadiia bacterium]